MQPAPPSGVRHRVTPDQRHQIRAGRLLLELEPGTTSEDVDVAVNVLHERAHLGQSALGTTATTPIPPIPDNLTFAYVFSVDAQTVSAARSLLPLSKPARFTIDLADFAEADIGRGHPYLFTFDEATHSWGGGRVSLVIDGVSPEEFASVSLIRDAGERC